MNVEKELQELKTKLLELEERLDTSQGKEILTMKATAEWLKVSRQSLHRWKNEGVIPAYFLGGKLFFKRSEILEIIDAGKITVIN